MPAKAPYNSAVRYLSLVLFAFAPILASDTPAPPALAYPLWDGHEPVADYAKRVNLPATKTLDLGNGVTLELVLIPAGEFMMGVPEAQPVDQAPFKPKILWAKNLEIACGFVLLIFIFIPIVRAVLKKQRPKYSLAWLLGMTIAAGGVVMSVLYCRDCCRSLERANEEYRAATVRYAHSNDDEKPAHKVMLTHSFYIGKFPVTQKQYQHVMSENPSEFNGPDNPVELIKWGQAQVFCRRVQTSQRVDARLPTEAEWEFACRAGTQTDYYSGDSEADLARVAWYNGNSGQSTHPVGQKEPNAFGLYDMHGNVLQWCEDFYDWTYYLKVSDEVDPQGPVHPDPPALRVLRGGSFSSEFLGHWDCRATHRMYIIPVDESKYWNAGVRIVVPVSATAQ